MSLVAVLLPVFVQIALTFALMLWMGAARRSALTSRAVAMRDIALGQNVWPQKVVQIGNAFHNQLETPVLFYVAVALSLASVKPDLIFVCLEWLFAGARLAHAFVHTGGNDVRLRGPLFGIGVLALAAMWLEFAARVLLAG